MKQNSTTVLPLLKYLYRETTPAENVLIEQALAENEDLRSNFSRLQQAQQQLPKVKFNAGRKSLQAVLRYSREAAFSEQS